MSQRTKPGSKTAAEYVLTAVLLVAVLALVFLMTVMAVYGASGTQWPVWLTTGPAVVGVVSLSAALGLMWMRRGEHQKR